MRKLYFQKLILGFVVCLNYLFISCNNQEIQKVTIAQTGDFFLYAPLYIAKDASIFTKNGLDVTIISTGGDEKTWAAVLSGNASFGVSDPTFVAISDEKGVPGKVVASIVNGVPFWGITYEDISPFESPHDLNGFVVGTFPSPSTAYTLQKRMFEDAGLKPSIREGAFGTMLAMLKSNQADIVLELEPNVSQSLSDGAHIVYSLSEIYGDFLITGLTTTPDIIKNDPDLVFAVINSIQEAIDFISTSTDSALLILSNRFPEIEYNVALDALNRVLNDKIIPKNVLIQEDAWNKAIELRRMNGDIINLKDFEYYVDNSFAIMCESNSEK